MEIIGALLVSTIAGLSTILGALVIFLKLKAQNTQKTGMEEKYIGQIATVIEDVNTDCGAVTIYDERWQARSNELILKGEKVKIKSYQGLIFQVEKI